MTRAEAEEILSSYRQKRREAEGAWIKAESLMDSVSTLQATSYDRPVVRRSVDQDAMALKIGVMLAEGDRLQELYQCKQREADWVLAEISGTMCAMADPLGTLTKLLRLRFVDGLPWEDVAEEMAFALRRVYQLRLEALDAFAEAWERMHFNAVEVVQK